MIPERERKGKEKKLHLHPTVSFPVLYQIGFFVVVFGHYCIHLSHISPPPHFGIKFSFVRS